MIYLFINKSSNNAAVTVNTGNWMNYGAWLNFTSSSSISLSKATYAWNSASRYVDDATNDTYSTSNTQEYTSDLGSLSMSSFQSAGIRRARFTITDVAGNTATIKVILKIDTTAPRFRSAKWVTPTDSGAKYNLQPIIYDDESHLSFFEISAGSCSNSNSSSCSTNYDHQYNPQSGGTWTHGQMPAGAGALNTSNNGVWFRFNRACDVAGNCVDNLKYAIVLYPNEL